MITCQIPTTLAKCDKSISRLGKKRSLTLVECRIHNATRQHVTWIEELIGRRISLQAASVVAVSSSGFTKGAKAKAARHGIVLRDFRSLSDAEILNWGRSVRLTLHFYQYSDVNIRFLTETESLFPIGANDLPSAIKASPILISVFGAAAKLLGQRGLGLDREWSAAFRFKLVPESPAFLAGQSIRALEMRAKAKLISREIECPVMQVYGAPEIDPGRRGIVIESFKHLGETSIIHDGAKVSILLDLSVVNKPPLTQFRYWEVNGQQDMDIEKVGIVGIDALGVSSGPMHFDVGRTLKTQVRRRSDTRVLFG
jgi:hypothetical protein